MQNPFEQPRPGDKKPPEASISNPYLGKNQFCFLTQQKKANVLFFSASEDTIPCDVVAKGYEGDDDLPPSVIPPPNPIIMFSQEFEDMIEDNDHRAVCPNS
jgi:hypothetical protein